MNLKESYRYQNVMLDILNSALTLLSRQNCVTKRTYTNLLSKVVPDMEDEQVCEEPSYPNFRHFDKITELAEFVEYVIKEKESLAAAIRAAKGYAEIDIDSQSGLNSLRQKAARIMRMMDDNKTEEKVVAKGGVGYRFDANGNQVPFKCDQKVVTQINFDRNKVRNLVKRFEHTSDYISSALDAALVNLNVDFVPSFDVNDSFDNMFERYLEMRLE